MLLIIHHTTQNVFKVFVIYKVYFTKHNLLLTVFFFLSCLIRELYMEEFVSTLCFQGHLMPIAFQKKM